MSAETSEPVLDEESKRVSLQVTSLSTQLIDLVDKQSKLEEQVVTYKREAEHLKKQNHVFGNLEKNHKALQAEHENLLKLNETLGKKLEDETNEKNKAKEEVSKLQSEVEDLSASLFDEANKMVSDARREAHEIGERNKSLISQLKEKDLLLDNLQTQLRELKNVIHEKEDQSIADSARNSIDESRSGGKSDDQSNSIPQQIVYTPTINAIRFDLKLFKEFNKFIADLKYIEVIKDTNTKFLKKIVADDVEPALRIDLAHGIGWLSKRTLMGAFIDGRVIIEPVSGINETYRINFQNNKAAETDIKSNLYSYPAHSPPVAIDQPCAICGEDRNDILEHTRLYILKVHAPKSKEDSITSINSTPSSPVIAHQYALCSHCLFRVRSACELFAFLRSLKTNIWKLDDEISIRKAWVELSRLRCKLFWSKVGIWDLESNIQQTKIYPGTDDQVYRGLANMEAPKATSAKTVQSDTLSESFALEKPKSGTESSNYKGSPLINQVNADGLDKEPANAVTLKEDKSPVEQTEETLPVVTTEEVKDEEEEDDDNDITNDILNDYSQDEDEEEDQPNTPVKPINGLHIQTDRPQDDLLASEENTPIAGQLNRFEDTETPTQGSSGFDFVPNSAEKDKQDESTTGKSSSKNETEDEDEFVDA